MIPPHLLDCFFSMINPGQLGKVRLIVGKSNQEYLSGNKLPTL
ncbi:hypothetical protein LEP1GSC192_0373 [Leptospira sp. B5-022]|nr:hypothetical protein LEP1GSC192_0373 [Leptospira sp. B5-022]